MNDNHILVAYATRGGASAEAALKIADVLRSRGFEVDVVNLRDKPSPDLSPLQARCCWWRSKSPAGLQRSCGLSRVPQFRREERGSFHFSLRGWGYENLPEGCGKIYRSIAKKCPHVKPVAAEAFGGRIRFLGFTVADTLDLGKLRLGRKASEKNCKANLSGGF